MTLLLSSSAARLSASPMRDALRETLPKYDPVVRQQALAEAERAPQATEPTSRESPPRPAVKLAASPDGALQLPEVVVEAPRAKPNPLPRVHETPPPNRVVIEPFASPKEREAQLVKRHLTPLDRDGLNRFTLPLVGQSREKRAKEAEAIAQNARQLNSLADMIEYLERQGASPEEIEQLKKLYFEMYLARPK